MGVLGGLGAAVSWGVADFIARGATQREGSLKALLYLQLTGSPAAAMLLFFSEGDPWQHIYSPAGLVAVFIGLEVAVSTILLYRALAAGPLLIVSPIASGFAAVAVGLSLLSGERPGTGQLVGMVMTLVGVALAAITSGEAAKETRPDSTGQPYRWLSPGIVFALGTALLSGVGVWLLGFIVPVLGSVATVFVTRISCLAFVVTFFLVSRRSFQLRCPSSLKWLLPLGVLDTVGAWSLYLGLFSGLTSVVSVISSLFGVVTVILGYALAGERVTRIQQVGIVTTFVGVALVSI